MKNAADQKLPGRNHFAANYIRQLQLVTNFLQLHFPDAALQIGV
uniref:Uncharacterized protein n=1 Tax=Rheinheimera sp. BAL341 TaxID=1708203 RepID=A0A486XWI5_9GAMM